MTLRYFFQSSLKTNSKFEILILVIILTTRLIECEDEATEAPAGGEESEAPTEEAHGEEGGEAEKCDKLFEADLSCTELMNFTQTYAEIKDGGCLIKPDEEQKLCALIVRCPEVYIFVERIYQHSLMPTEEGSDVYVKRNDTKLPCAGSQEVGNGQMLSSSLSLSFAVVGGWMIYLRYD